jgi:hypothetical protein
MTTLDAPILLTDSNDILTALVANQLQIMGRNKKWYDVKKNGQIKIWKRQDRVEVPCKIGLRDCFRLTLSKTSTYEPVVDGWGVGLRIRPSDFNSKMRT